MPYAAHHYVPFVVAVLVAAVVTVVAAAVHSCFALFAAYAYATCLSAGWQDSLAHTPRTTVAQTFACNVQN